MPVNIVWPDERVVPDDVLLGWAADAVANGEIDGPADLGVDELALQLSHAGLITLVGERPVDVRDRMAADPISSHDPDCGCDRCFLGDDAWLWSRHPSEY